MAADAAAAQAAADKMAADEAAAQAEADKMAADAAAAQAEADKMAADAAAAQAEADKMAADDAAAAAAAQAAVDLKAAQDAADAAAAQAAVDLKAAEDAADAAAAQAAVALKAAEDAADAAAAQAAVALKAAEDAADAAAAQAALDLKAAQDALAAVPETIEELKAALEVAEGALKEAEKAKTDADMKLEDATEAREMAQAGVLDSELGDEFQAAIETLDAARVDEEKLTGEALAAAVVVLEREADVAAAKFDLAVADTGPASGELDDQDIAGARVAFEVLAELRDDGGVIRAGDSLSASDSGKGAKFKAGSGTTAFETDADKMAPAIDGWRSAVMTGTRSGDKANAHVYGNVAAPKDELFATTYVLQTNGSTVLTEASWSDARVEPSTPYSGDGSSGAVMGTFDDVDGRFTCTGSCPTPVTFPTRRGNGSFISVPAGTWEFKPTDKAATVKVVDTDHLSFGYWLSKSSTGLPTNFRVWYGGGGSKSAVAGVTALNTLDEEVTYKGAAGGKYVVKDDIENTATPGYFTATAELKADFRASQIPTTAGEDNVAKLSGSISDFDADELGDLTLSLSGYLMYDTDTNELGVRQDAHNDHDGDDGTTPAVASNTVKAKSGGASHGTVGAWEAQFFGSEKNTNIPTGVAGAFNADRFLTKQSWWEASAQTR